MILYFLMSFRLVSCHSRIFLPEISHSYLGYLKCLRSTSSLVANSLSKARKLPVFTNESPSANFCCPLRAIHCLPQNNTDLAMDFSTAQLKLCWQFCKHQLEQHCWCVGALQFASNYHCPLRHSDDLDNACAPRPSHFSCSTHEKA